MTKESNTSKQDDRAAYPFATKSGIEMLCVMLLHNGDMCPKCGYGTRHTSGNWAKCKQCGERVRRAPSSGPEKRKEEQI